MIRTVSWILAVALIGWIGFQIVEISAGTASRDERRTYPAPRALSISADSGDVRIEPTAGDRLIVETHARGSLRVPHVDARMLEPGHLDLNADCELLEGRCSVSFVVRVPAGTKVSASTDSGDIRAGGLTRGASLASDSGDVRGSDIAGDVSLTTDSGDIEVHDMRTDKAAVRSDSGNIGVTFDAPPHELSVSTDSGDVAIVVPRTGEGYDVNHSTDSGDEVLDVRVDPASQRKITVHTDSGGIVVTYG